MSAYNLVMFLGVFVMQWSMGLLIDGFGSLGWSLVESYQGAMAVFMCCCAGAYGFFLSRRALHR